MSKLFLIVSGALAVLGAILMLTGFIMSKKSGVQLFQQKVDGKYLYTLDLSDKEVVKIAIDATDTDINVITGSDSDYIEFINFNENYYSISTTNKVVKFEENVSINSLINFWDGNFTFKGIRSFFSLGRSIEGQKEVNIHLTDTTDINIFSFVITDGDVTVENASGNTDYIITMDSGNVTMNNVRTESKVMINGNDCTVKFSNCSFTYFASDIVNVDMTAKVDGLHSFEFTGKKGSVTADLTAVDELFDVRISSDLAFSYNGEDHTGEFTNNDKSTNVTDDYGIVHIDGDEVAIKLNLATPNAKPVETEVKE